VEPLRDEALIRRGQRYLYWGGALVLVTASAASTQHPIGYVITGLGAVLGGLFIYSGVEVRRAAIAVPVYRKLVGLVGRGELDEAEKLLDEVRASPAFEETLVARVVTTLRASIANAKGDPSRAVAAADEALALPRRAGRVWDDVLHLEARSHRAFANAVLGNTIAEDVDVISGAKHAVASLIARAELACAVVLAKTEKKSELADHLRQHAGLILGHANPRERALYRALRAWTRASNAVYREAPRPSGDGKLRAWIERVVPAASPFAPNEHEAKGEPTKLPPVDAARSSAVIAARLAHAPNRPRRRASTFILAVLGFFAFVFAGTLNAVGITIAGLLVLALIAYLRAFGNRGQTAILEAERHIASGRIPLARKDLRRVANAGGSLGASAGHHLAMLANREGDFAAAIEEARQALALCKEPAVLEATRFFVVPGLLAETAVAFAALERFEDADRELAVLREGFPDYGHLASTLFRVQLVSAMRRGDLEGAAALAAARPPDLALDFATELLAELALGDRSFEAELGSHPMTAAWLRKVAPAAYGAGANSTSSYDTAPTAS
jgi:tetratricopeptide (TPR) repeat protein